MSAQDSPQPLQGLDNFSIERPAPARPDAAATPVPVPAAPVIALPAPTDAPTRQPRARASAPAAAPSALPTPVSTPGISAVTPAVEATPLPIEIPVARPSADDGRSWWWAVALVLLAALGSAFAFWWRSRGEEAVEQTAPPPLVVAEPVTPAPAPAVPNGGFVTSGLRATIELQFHPLRAAIDTLRVQLEYQLVIANTGAAKSRELFVELAMLSAGNSQDMALASFYGAEPGEPIAESDGLAAGNLARLGGEAVLPRDAFDLITAGNKRMIVPLIAVRVLGPTGAIVAKAAWLVGIEREGEARMAPLRLDGRAVQEGLGVRAYP